MTLIATIIVWAIIEALCAKNPAPLMVLIVLFVARQFRSSHPLLNFEVLKYRAFTITLLIQCALAMTLGITALLAQLYLQLHSQADIISGYACYMPHLPEWQQVW